ncbi:LLM class flavin-dependent oxidoreductase [Actinomadura physcomitrii]|nr:TIGR03619 family F420-dependent LLM class oxidoreductase [Actinomadura physcomitrii]
MTGGPSVRFGSVITVTDERVVETARAMEAQGWDILATGEHVSFNLPIANAFVSLAAAAAVTTKLRLMSSVALLPLYPAGLAAKMAAALDNVSGGRFLFGIGVGGENPREFDACGVPVAERGSRTDESLEVIRRLWSGEDVSHEGRHYAFEKVRIAPAPVQRPGPPIWVAGRKDAAMRRAARHGDGWMPYMYSPEMLAESLAKVAAWRERPEPIEGGAYLWSCVHEDTATAVRYAEESLGKTYRQDFSSMVDRYLVVGDPDHAVRRTLDYIDAGATTVIFGAAAPRAYAERHVEMLATEVVPRIRAELARRQVAHA